MTRTCSFLIGLIWPVLGIASEQTPAVDRRVSSATGEELLISCSRGDVSVEVAWNRRVGHPGHALRHLFYAFGGNKHLMLPVVDGDGTVTGYAEQPLKAKLVLGHMLATLPSETFYVSVFPEDSDPIRGEWVTALFPSTQFKDALQEVAAACGWRIEAEADLPPLPDVVAPAPLPHGS